MQNILAPRLGQGRSHKETGSWRGWIPRLVSHTLKWERIYQFGGPAKLCSLLCVMHVKLSCCALSVSLSFFRMHASATIPKRLAHGNLGPPDCLRQVVLRVQVSAASIDEGKTAPEPAASMNILLALNDLMRPDLCENSSSMCK